jgi:peptidoglycan/LPS O-acetylase OafA/YrhL
MSSQPSLSAHAPAPTVPGVLKHFPALDGIRAVAFLLVLAFHVDELWHHLGQPRLLNYIDAVLLSLWVGVDLFFVLSGFLITRILLASKGQTAYFRHFFTRRVLRIFPLYFVFLLGAAAWVMVSGSSGPPRADGTPWWAYLTFTQNWVFASDGWIGARGLMHLWSVAVEEQFYLLWPLVIAYAGRERLRWVVAVLMALPMVLRMVLAGHASHGILNYTATLTHVDTLAAGALLALIFEQPGQGAWLSRHAGRLMLAGLAAMTAIWLAEHGFQIDDAIVQTLGHMAVALAAFGAVALGVLASVNPSAQRPNWFVRAMNRPTLRWVGRHSYASYVLHWPIALGLRNLLLPLKLAGGPALLVHFGLTLGVTLLAAELSWQFWESRWLALPGRLTPSAAAVV